MKRDCNGCMGAAYNGCKECWEAENERSNAGSD